MSVESVLEVLQGQGEVEDAKNGEVRGRTKERNSAKKAQSGVTYTASPAEESERVSTSTETERYEKVAGKKRRVPRKERILQTAVLGT